MTTTTITNQIRALHDLTVAQLAERYGELFGKPPRVRNRAFLLRQVAWALQMREFGGLSERAKARLAELMAQVTLPIGNAPPPSRPPVAQRAEARGPMPGTTLIREWHGQQIRVEVRDNGFEYAGVIYKSLSAVAKAITGASWNGRLFFGLTTRKAGA